MHISFQTHVNCTESQYGLMNLVLWAEIMLTEMSFSLTVDGQNDQFNHNRSSTSPVVSIMAMFISIFC